MERRRDTGWKVGGAADDPIPRPVLLWQKEVHTPGIYDLEVDTWVLSPEECAAAIRRHLDDGPPPPAFRQLAETVTTQDRKKPYRKPGECGRLPTTGITSP